MDVPSGLAFNMTAQIIWPIPWNTAEATDKENIEKLLLMLNSKTTIEESKNPDIDRKKPLVNNPVNITLINKTLKKPIEKYSFLPKKYKRIKFIVFAKPNFTPGIGTIVGKKLST